MIDRHYASGLDDESDGPFSMTGALFQFSQNGLINKEIRKTER